ncbi:hypothetical protein MBLNU459_g1935t1 [Dothideomycetes sp. NU459]
MAIGNNGCTPWTPGVSNAYGYKPSLAAGIVYCVLFGLSMLFHVFQTIRTRAWWTIVFSIGALTELLGWAARTWSSECPYNSNAFLMQICTLIIAPTFFAAGIYVILGRMIQILGRGTSPISPVLYLWIFCTIDVISLVVQAVGGGLAAVAFEETPEGNTDVGTNTMVAGIDFQLAALVVFAFLFSLVIFRTSKRYGKEVFTKDKDMRLLVATTTFAILLIIMRSIYRTIELAGGWTGHVIETQRLFIALDGAPMAALVIMFNVFHPGALVSRIAADGDARYSRNFQKERPSLSTLGDTEPGHI